MMKITVNKFFKQKNVCQRFDFFYIKLLSERQMRKSEKKVLYKKRI